MLRIRNSKGHTEDNMRALLRSSFLVSITATALFAAGCEGDSVVASRGKLETACCSDLDPSLRVADRVDFGNVQIGIQSSRELLVKNGGDAILTISKIDVEDTFSTGAYEFKLSKASLVLGPSEEEKIIVSFQPYDDMQEAVTTVISVVSDAKDQAGNAVPPFRITLSGRGVPSGLEVIPNPVEFGNVLIGSSAVLTVQVKNNLAVPVDVTTPLGADGKPEIVNQGGLGRFEMLSPVSVAGSIIPPNADGTPKLLPPGESVMIDLRYTPDQGQEGREERAKWTLSNCTNPLCELDVTLKGTGTNTAIQCTPPSIEYGDVNPNTVVTKTTTCRNTATEVVTITSVELAPGTAREYEVEPYRGPASLAPEQTFEVSARFSPTLATVNANPTGSIVIEGRNPNANRDLDPARVTLTGSAGGPDIAVTPAMLNFGQIAIGTSGRRRILIENTGYNPLVVESIDGDGARTNQFSVNRMSFSIDPGQSEIVEVVFTPVAAGASQSQVIITSNDADEAELRVDIRGEGVNLPPCQYTLQPLTVNFGIVQVQRSTTQGVRIQNIGNNDCLINDIEVAIGSDQVFGLLNGVETGVILRPSETKSVIITYTPDDAGVDQGSLTFYISDPRDPNVEIPLRGVGSESALLISPNEIDFGRIGINCSTRDRVITIFNTGSQATSVTRIERPAGVTAEFQIDNLPAGVPSPPNAGATILPGQSIDFVVRYHANDLGIDTGFIHLFEQGETDPYVIPVYGEGATDPTNEDHFTQLETPEVDILFVIDNSCSMSEEQANLVGNFRSFIQFADSQALDYHLSVVTTDVDDVQNFGNCPNPLVAQRPAGVAQGQCGYFADGNYDNSQQDPDWRIITPDEQPSAEVAFTAVASQDIGGSGFEQGLQAAFQAFSSPVLTGWNDGFLRPTAYLAVIVVSDEQDQSPQTIDFYTNFFLAIKGFRNTHLFSLSGIVGNTPGGCSGPGGSADDGIRYIEVARRTGGIFESICTTDWAQALQNLGLSVFGYKSKFFLSNQPVPGTVTVLIDGIEVAPTAPSGQVRWSYDTATNSVNFAPLAIPEPGSEIVITYPAECLR
jgi:hypothetical protein